MKTFSKKTKQIIKHLESGKTQTEVRDLGYPFGTVRYHYQRLFKPKKFERFMKKHKDRIKKRRMELSTIPTKSK